MLTRSKAVPVLSLFLAHARFSNDWDETFQYLSREVLASEVIEPDLQQQVPTPPVRHGPHPQTFCHCANFTLPYPLIKGLGHLLALFHGEYDSYLCLDLVLSRG